MLPGYKDVDKDSILSQIGSFDFTFYFMKRAYSTPDLEKFYYIAMDFKTLYYEKYLKCSEKNILESLNVLKNGKTPYEIRITMYPSYIRKGRDMILYFLKKHFDDKDRLIIPIKLLKIETEDSELASIFNKDTFKEDYRILNKEIRELGYNIPPLVNAYMSLSPTMRMFGTAINYGFGDVEETGILIAVDEIQVLN